VTSLADTELLRARWRRALDRHAVDTIERDDFATSGLAARLCTPTVQLLLLPSDPEAEVLHIDDELWAWIDAQKNVQVEGRTVHLGLQKTPTAHAAALVSSFGNGEQWNNYFAVNRSGAVELGLGDRGASESPNPESNPVPIFDLISIVTHSWAMLKFSAALNERFSIGYPMQLTIALRATEDALLGNFGQGWENGRGLRNRVGGCAERNLLWHVEINNSLDDDGQTQLAFLIGDWIENAWGISQRRYLARKGDRTGRLDVNRMMD